MINYVIKKTLEKTDSATISNCKEPFVASISKNEWAVSKELYGFLMDTDIDFSELNTTKVNFNGNSLTGTFSIPDREKIKTDEAFFGFAINKKGIVFIDDSGFTETILSSMAESRKHKISSIEKFIYDFLDKLTCNDIRYLEKYEFELDEMEEILVNKKRVSSLRISEIRGELRKYVVHYDQLMDLMEDFMENEDQIFKNENLRYFRSFDNRLARLRANVEGINDHTLEVRDLRKEMIDIKQNRITTVLTVVTTIFMPLTLITGWYGMNFRYMPELEWHYSYPILIVFCLVLVVSLLIFFKKKKWL